MKKLMSIAAVMVFALTLGLSSLHAAEQKAEKTGCPMMGGQAMQHCMTGKDGNCPMQKDKCPNPSHHGGAAAQTEVQKP